MPTAKNYADHQWMLEALKDQQSAEHDMREQAREAQDFITSRSGQWEQHWWDKNADKPRYTFDQVSPIVDQHAGTLERSDFSITVAPAGGDASQEIAETYSGLIRNIEHISGAEHIYNMAGRIGIECGLDGWRVANKFVDGDSFDQDLVIEKIPNYLDRVWHGPHEEPDASDAQFAFILTGLSPEEFKESYPDAQASGVGSDRQSNTYFHRDDLVMVGEFLYFQPEDRELVLVSTGAVFEAEKFDVVRDELLQNGINEVSRRTRSINKVMSRKFSANEWLEDPRETVFRHWIPVVPYYCNFKVSNDKRIYFGAVEKLMDAQRVLNYSMSREIEEGALAPRAKYWLTGKEIEGHEDELAELNVSAAPYQEYNLDPQMPQRPMLSGGPQINPGLRTISESMRQVIGQNAGMFAANMGDNPGLQSGVAIDALQDRGDTGTNKYLEAMEIAQQHTARILVDAMPRVYEPKRQVRVLGEDGTRDLVTIGEITVVDQQSGEQITLSDLESGKYDVTCKAGPSFKNKQNETVNAITEIGKVAPEVVQMSADILAKNVTSPGMNDVGGRMRRQLFVGGLIPPDQLTDEERAELQAQQQAAANQPPQEDPNMVLARAEEAKAQADAMAVQQKVQESERKHMIEMGKLENEKRSLEIEFAALQIKAQEAGVSIDLKRADARKKNVEADAQEIQNLAVKSDLLRLVQAPVEGGFDGAA